MTKYPSNTIEDGELTDPEIRRLVHEIVRERIRPLREHHIAQYWAAREKHEASDKRGGQDLTPFPEYDPSELHATQEVLTREALCEVLKFKTLDLAMVRKG